VSGDWRELLGKYFMYGRKILRSVSGNDAFMPQQGKVHHKQDSRRERKAFRSHINTTISTSTSSFNTTLQVSPPSRAPSHRHDRYSVASLTKDIVFVLRRCSRHQSCALITRSGCTRPGEYTTTITTPTTLIFLPITSRSEF